jgi:hypothetical protein
MNLIHQKNSSIALRCLANILPDKGPKYAKEKNTALAIGPQKHGRVPRAGPYPIQKSSPSFTGEPLPPGKLH